MTTTDQSYQVENGTESKHPVGELMKAARQQPIRGELINTDRLILALQDVDVFLPAKREMPWFTLIKALPANLRAALLLELEAGSQIRDIDRTNWPHEGSIFVAMKNDFKNDFTSWRAEVRYTFLDDARYWKAELVENVNGVDYFIIT